MNNYTLMLQDAARRFCTYDPVEIAERTGVSLEKGELCTTFLGEPVRVDTRTGTVRISGREGNFGESLTLYDWLCDSRPDAAASHIYCPVGSLPGIFVGGSGLVMNSSALAEKIDRDPAAFARTCEAMGGKKIPLGDLGYQLPAFPGLDIQLKFYRSDEEFPPSLTLLWDQNILQFIRYETVYYLAGCLLRRLEASGQCEGSLA